MLAKRTSRAKHTENRGTPTLLSGLPSDEWRCVPAWCTVRQALGGLFAVFASALAINAVGAVELFGPAQVSFPVGSYAISVAIGDFNADGAQDLAVANYGGNSVSILLGDGLGGFARAPNIAVGSFPVSVAIGDFNGDGAQDLAVASFYSDSVSILLGDSLGGFARAPDIAVGSGPGSVAVGDFNGDGAQDLAVANAFGDSVSICLGDGIGGFARTSDLAVGSGPNLVAIGDFNADGAQDLSVANSSSDSVSILLGDGFAGFARTPDLAVGSSPLSVAIGVPTKIPDTVMLGPPNNRARPKSVTYGVPSASRMMFCSLMSRCSTFFA